MKVLFQFLSISASISALIIEIAQYLWSIFVCPLNIRPMNIMFGFGL
jgi:hypothetical protein